MGALTTGILGIGAPIQGASYDYNFREGVSKCKFRHTLLSCVRVSKMQGVEIEDEGSVLKYMTKSEIEEQHSSLLIMTQRRGYPSGDAFSVYSTLGSTAILLPKIFYLTPIIGEKL